MIFDERNAKKIRLIAFDLDGTLTQHKSPLGETNRKVLEELAKNHKLVMVGAGQCVRIFKQMGEFPIDIIGNYGMQFAAYDYEKQTLGEVTNLAVDCEYFNYFATLINPSLKDTVNSIEGHIIVSLSDEQFNYFNYLKGVINTIPSDETQQRNINYDLLLFNMLSIFNISTCRENETYPSWFSSLLNEISKT